MGIGNSMLTQRKFFWWTFCTAVALIATWLLTTVWFPVTDYQLENVQTRYYRLLDLQKAAMRMVPSGALSEQSPDGSIIAYFENYNGYGDSSKPATVFTIIDRNKAKVIAIIPFYRTLGNNIGRGIDTFKWLDSRYLVTYGDLQLSVIDTDQKKQIIDMVSDGYVASPDGTKVAYMPPLSPLYGPASDQSRGIEVLDIKTGKTTDLTNIVSGGEPASPSVQWSPDSNLLFVSEYLVDHQTVSGSPFAMWVLKPDGSGARQVSTNENFISNTDSIQWKNNTTIGMTYYSTGQPRERMYEYDYAKSALTSLTPDEDYKTGSLSSVPIKDANGLTANIYVYSSDKSVTIIKPGEASCVASEGATEYTGNYNLILDPGSSKAFTYDEYPLGWPFVKDTDWNGQIIVKQLGSKNNNVFFLKESGSCNNRRVHAYGYSTASHALLEYGFQEPGQEVTHGYQSDDAGIITTSQGHITAHYYDNSVGTEQCREWVIDPVQKIFLGKVCY